ncbi:iron-containing alcohol dehydrogenase [Gammaproteobacteria bacterium]|nr:iron-containing alcohol dehydrogenase [Gammaproteobacteria bacterium]
MSNRLSPGMKICSYRHEYELVFIDNFLTTLSNSYEDGDYIVVDNRVCQLHTELSEFVKARRNIIIEANEATKSFERLGSFIESLIENNFTRANRLIAIGGGVTQDLTSFVASILFRGVNWLFFPTTLLAQCDSCIGSKTSINFGKYKNQLGSFFPPKSIFIDTRFLKTLPKSELRSGLGEMLHYYLVTSESDLQMVEEHGDQALVDDFELRRFISRSLEIKKAMIEVDEFDKGPRAVFNYGHSFGHAIEAATQNQVPHGIAVAYGMDLANILSVELGMISKQLRNRIRLSLAKVFTGTDLPEIDADLIFAALRKDKKNQGKDIKVILTRGIGDMYKTTLENNDQTNQCIRNFFKNRCYETDL